MSFRTARKPRGKGYLLGIKPTDADREYVRTLSRTMVPVRRICERLGERFGLGKPISRLSLYHHFRAELERRPTRVKLPEPSLAREDVSAMLEKLRARRRPG